MKGFTSLGFVRNSIGISYRPKISIALDIHSFDSNQSDDHSLSSRLIAQPNLRT